MSVPYSDIGKCLNFVEILSSERYRCVISWLCNHRFLSVDWFTVTLFTVLHTERMESGVFLCFLSMILLVFFLFPLKVNFVLWDFTSFPTAEWFLWAESLARMFSNVALAQPICLFYSLISRDFALQGALVMVQVSRWNLPVYNRVPINIFMFEFQSESGANVFHVFGFFLHFWFWCNVTANF